MLAPASTTTASSPAAGRFIVLEGLDGAGTTTQSARLVEALRARGKIVVATREPTDGPVGRLLRASLRGEPEAPEVRALPWLFAADRADHLYREIEPALATGAWVVSDRYIPSSLAYQSMTLPFDRVFSLNAEFRVPDLTVFLSIPVDTALERLGNRSQRDIYEVREQLEPIAAQYERVFAELERRGQPILRLDATLPIEVIEAHIRAAVDAL
jgi:dTMP kinase